MGQGIVLAMEGKLEEAAKFFHRALELEPNRADAYEGLGNVLAEMGKKEEAIAAYRRAIALYPDGAIAASPYNNLGLTLIELGQWDEGVKAYCHAIRLDPSFTGARYNLSNALALREIDIESTDLEALCQQLEK